jgi:hypothetical protein
MNTKYCVLLGLSLFLEQWIRNGDGATSQWLFCDGTTDETSIEILETPLARPARAQDMIIASHSNLSVVTSSTSVTPSHPLSLSRVRFYLHGGFYILSTTDTYSNR